MKFIPKPFSNPAITNEQTLTDDSSLLSRKVFKFAAKNVFALSGKNLVS